uniref:Uncharacterized protein n=1 Tax=Setaria viridis TaxID=4556 RepID=A0A4U6TJ41_SETVI|nr:hypothetical protein SEVIR_8G197650v2 [Setaria viridis]
MKLGNRVTNSQLLRNTISNISLWTKVWLYNTFWQLHCQIERTIFRVCVCTKWQSRHELRIMSWKSLLEGTMLWPIFQLK